MTSEYEKGNKRLLIFQTDVQSQDVRIFEPFWHIRVSSAMVEDQPPNELGLRRRPMLHFHDLNHVKINWLFPIFRFY
jgi:hypothetical protein